MNDNLPPTFGTITPWKEAKNSIWPATMMILHRNINPFPFPNLISDGDAKQTLKLLSKHLSPLLNIPCLLTHENLPPLEKEFLFEHFILSEGYEKFDSRKAILVDQSASILGLLNVEDHLHLHLFTSSDDLKPLWKQLSTIEKNLGSTLPFAFSPKFGYLTSDPGICGTGLVVQAFLHLPALISLKKFPEAIESLPEELLIRGLGKEDTYIGDLALLENRYKLGVSEEGILSNVTSWAKALVEKETHLRESLTATDKEFLKDQMSRAYGLFLHAYSLEIQESLRALSLLSLAKDLGWLKGADKLSFHTLFFEIRRAHLIKQEGLAPTTTKEAVMIKRAETIRKALEGSSFEV